MANQDSAGGEYSTVLNSMQVNKNSIEVDNVSHWKRHQIFKKKQYIIYNIIFTFYNPIWLKHFEYPSLQLLVFSVTPFKTDRNKNQNPSIDKIQNLGNERR